MSECSNSTKEQKFFNKSSFLARSDDWGKLIDIGVSSTKIAEDSFVIYIDNDYDL